MNKTARVELANQVRRKQQCWEQSLIFAVTVRKTVRKVSFTLTATPCCMHERYSPTEATA